MAERTTVGILLGSLALLGVACSASRRPQPATSTGQPSSAASPAARAPTAPVREAVDRYFGKTIVDPYRWMETPGSPGLRSWLIAQNAHTRGLLDRVSFAAELATRVQQLSSESTVVPEAHLAGGKLFFLERSPGRQEPRLLVRDGLSAVPRTLVDIEHATCFEHRLRFPFPAGEVRCRRALERRRREQHAARPRRDIGHGGRSAYRRVSLCGGRLARGRDCVLLHA